MCPQWNRLRPFQIADGGSRTTGDVDLDRERERAGRGDEDLRRSQARDQVQGMFLVVHGRQVDPHTASHFSWDQTT